MNDQSLVEELKQSINNGNIVVVSGTGVAIMACGDQSIEGHHIARWDGLLNHGVEYCLNIEHQIEPEDAEVLRLQIKRGKPDFLIAAAEHITSALTKKSPGVYRGWLKRTLGKLEPESCEVLEALASLGGVLTTLNYDPLFEKGMGRVAITWQDRDKVQAVLLGEMENAVVHLHGYYDQPDSVVFGLGSYAKVKDDLHTRTVLQLFTLDRTLLFVGCRGTVHDPNFDRLLEWASVALKDSTHRHFLLCRIDDLDAVRAELKSAPWLHAVSYGKEHSELVPFLRKLAPISTADGREAGRAAPVGPGFNLEAYRVAMRKRYGRLKLEELDPTTHDIDKSLTLTGMFIPQDARECAEYLPRVFELPKEVQRRLHERGEIDAPKVDERLLKEYRRVYHGQAARPVLDLIDDPALNHLVILGDPGSGKSTLLQYLLLRWAEKPPHSCYPVPLLVELREYARLRREGNALGFLQFIHGGESVRCHLDRQRLERWLGENPSLILFDGLDEVFDVSLRSEVAIAIQRFADDYPQARIIMTSRVVGYRHQTWEDEGFRHFMLQELEEPQIEEFLGRWHHAAYNDLAEGDRKRKLLERAITDSSAIRQLAGNPLLLTMMAILNRTQELPRDRSELYEQCARLLLHQWKADAAFAQGEALRGATLDYKDKRQLLMRVARAMLKAEGGLAANLIVEQELEDALAEGLSQYPNLRADRAARALIEQLRGRNFMLCSAGGSNYSFVHRTFLEYFCASDLRHSFEQQQTLTLEELKIQIYGGHWADETWHEVLCLLAGMLAPRFVKEIISTLLNQKDRHETYLHLFLAARCVGEFRQRSDIGQTEAEVQRRLKALTRLRGSELDFETDFERLDQISRLSVRAVHLLATIWPSDKRVKTFLKARAVSRPCGNVEREAVFTVARVWQDEPDTITWLKSIAEGKNDPYLCEAAVEAVASRWNRSFATESWLRYIAESDRVSQTRGTAIQAVVGTYKDVSDTLSWAKARAESDENRYVREQAVVAVANASRTDPKTLQWLKTRAQGDEDGNVRWTAVRLLVRDWKADPEVLTILKGMGQSGMGPAAREWAVEALAAGWKDHHETLPWLKELARFDKYSAVRQAAVKELALGWKDDPSVQSFLESVQK